MEGFETKNEKTPHRQHNGTGDEGVNDLVFLVANSAHLKPSCLLQVLSIHPTHEHPDKAVMLLTDKTKGRQSPGLRTSTL